MHSSEVKKMSGSMYRSLPRAILQINHTHNQVTAHHLMLYTNDCLMLCLVDRPDNTVTLQLNRGSEHTRREMCQVHALTVSMTFCSSS